MGHHLSICPIDGVVYFPDWWLRLRPRAGDLGSDVKQPGAGDLFLDILESGELNLDLFM